ncbi:pyridoxamine 5'-phosphate oxidase [Skermania sp. ID1734]|uniref:pyridoxamine 5'-phosphate oxidase n=1 Tax=Skermania sp. ID1734 TaxID=2597516 RepID=UPI00117EEB2F|nr:pyridoxamine 5'-phosphate oxidase [Skermania sp. ID1734]TSD96679.1 pyridoxamine 5'-phosphate oxidase [Skermania sp. ID1734]
MRRSYGGDHDLDETWLSDGWEPVLRRWLHDAMAASVVEPNAMVLATVDADGCPATRTVLCKGIAPDGVTFYTNYGSAKAIQLQQNPNASVTFAWPLIGRQVTLRGRVERVSRHTTELYWATRPRGSQLGAWASHQSQPIGSRAELEQALTDAAARFAGQPIPVPPNWGGMLLRPASVEFWQGRESRLHNRIRVTAADGRWIAERLQP